MTDNWELWTLANDRQWEIPDKWWWQTMENDRQWGIPDKWWWQTMENDRPGEWQTTKNYIQSKWQKKILGPNCIFGQNGIDITWNND